MSETPSPNGEVEKQSPRADCPVERAPCNPPQKEAADTPAWLPPGMELRHIPRRARRAAEEIVRPVYEQLVAGVADPLEKAAGVSLCYALLIEILNQGEFAHELRQSSPWGGGAIRAAIESCQRMVNVKVKAGTFLQRLREFAFRKKTAARSGKGRQRRSGRRPPPSPFDEMAESFTEGRGGRAGAPNFGRLEKC